PSGSVRSGRPEAWPERFESRRPAGATPARSATRWFRVTVLTRRGDTWSEAVFRGDQVIVSLVLPGFATTMAEPWADIEDAAGERIATQGKVEASISSA